MATATASVVPEEQNREPTGTQEPGDAQAAPADTGQQILELARDLFSRQGYRATSIRQLTSGLNLTTAALYYHFRDKEDVLAGVLAPMEQGGAALIARMAELERTPAALREILDRYFDLLASNMVVFRLVADDMDAQRSAVGQRLRSQARTLFAWLVGAEAASMASVDDRMRAAAAVGTIRLSLEQSGVDPEIHRETIIGRALRIMTD